MALRFVLTICFRAPVRPVIPAGLGYTLPLEAAATPSVLGDERRTCDKYFRATLTRTATPPECATPLDLASERQHSKPSKGSSR